MIGPYELNDFFLHHIIRFGQRPSKVAFLAWHAWRDIEEGIWPDDFPEARRHEYDLADNPQMAGEVPACASSSSASSSARPSPTARRCQSGGALSPRGDWRAPSDASAEPWLQELRDNVPES